MLCCNSLNKQLLIVHGKTLIGNNVKGSLLDSVMQIIAKICPQ